MGRPNRSDQFCSPDGSVLIERDQDNQSSFRNLLSKKCSQHPGEGIQLVRVGETTGNALGIIRILFEQYSPDFFLQCTACAILVPKLRTFRNVRRAPTFQLRTFRNVRRAPTHFEMCDARQHFFRNAQRVQSVV